MKKFLMRLSVTVLCVLSFTVPVQAADFLIPVGQVVGLELGTGTVTVAAFDEALGSAAKEAGLQVGDTLVRINGKEVAAVEDVHNALRTSDGTVTVEYLRCGKEGSLRLEPRITTDGPKLGVYLQQGITGIGTVTYFDPEDGSFGTLGHGVTEKSGALVPMRQGSAYSASVISVRKGTAGKPGQLIGAVDARKSIGTLLRNTDRGLFGISETGWQGTLLPIADADELHTGNAEILSTVSGNTPRKYSVEIIKIYPSDRDTGRNMLLRVTDPALLDATGGIVQGMSGSPILQDGKLVGAVTHVLVNAPDTGYGIFIENMLDAAE